MTDSDRGQLRSDGLTSSNLLPHSNRRSVLAFCIVNFVWWAGLYFYSPFLPVYVQASGASLDMVGVVLSAYAIPQVLLRIPVGILSDRLGKRKPLVITGIVASSLGALGLGLSGHPWLLFLTRMTTGIGAAMWVVFPIYFAAYYPASESGRAMALINFVRSIALIAASAGGGFIAERLGMREAFFGAAMLGVLALSALVFAGEQSPLQRKASSFHDFLSVATNPLLLVVSVIGIIMNVAIFSGLFGFLPIYAVDIGASSSQLGLITMVHMGFSAVGSLVAVWLCGKSGYRAAVSWAALLSGASLLAVPFISDVYLLMATQSVYGLTSGVIMTTMMTLSIRGVGREHQATAMGVFQAVYAIGMLCGPLVSGFLSAGLGISAVFYIIAALNASIAFLTLLPVFPGRSTA